ncbi:hypothetical protein I7I50_08595 [Histoplasma capsulatum G186AR]|uniref:Uncharacterized protein n=1 Tax=Ajellomyces capsulatus TaxID=5037 RepID=A0A8H7YR31_AJECA|nr:hypothetical protein I7I52_06110 [Histoplasma capsulatum]QSS73712.1 hypothetical protein I7I50_08595 [Histoplasma capsulatum G186AR]
MGHEVLVCHVIFLSPVFGGYFGMYSFLSCLPCIRFIRSKPLVQTAVPGTLFLYQYLALHPFSFQVYLLLFFWSNLIRLTSESQPCIFLFF